MTPKKTTYEVTITYKRVMPAGDADIAESVADNARTAIFGHYGASAASALVDLKVSVSEVRCETVEVATA